MTAFAGAAQAQSSVTVYGILDAGYVGANTNAVNTGAATVNASAPTAGQVGTKTTYSGLGDQAQSTSRIGFKGNEDLGGGKSAFFTAEFTITPTEATLSGNGNGGLKNRQTFVGLKQNGLGQFAVGTQYTLIYNSQGATNAGGNNNMVGNVMYVGMSENGSISNGTQQMGDNAAYTTRVSNALTVDSDSFGGVVGHALVVANNTNTTQVTSSAGVPTAGGNVNTNGWGLGADYTMKNLYVTAAYQALKQNSTAVNTLQPTTLGGAGGAGGSQIFYNAATPVATGMSTTNNPLNIQDNQAYIGASYDFGILKAYASWISRKASDTQNSAFYQKRTAEQIGVSAYVKPQIQVWAQAGIGNFTPMGQGQNSAHFNAWQLGSNYYLSKRTNLYAIYGQYAQANSTYNTYTSTGAVAGTYQTSLNANSYAVGIRHTF
jgi:predicted porin